ncbi:MAG: glycosyltransferase [Chryseolinea sp.]
MEGTVQAMRVVRIINSLDFGGIERVFEITAQYYQGSKNNLIFISIGAGGAAEKFISSLGYRVIVINRRTRIPNMAIIWKLCLSLKKEKPDIVHTCGAEGNFHGLLAAWIVNVPVRIGEEIGMPSHSNVAKKIFGFIYGRSSVIIAVANSVGEYLIKNREVKPEKLRVVYNPVDVARFIDVKHIITDDFIILTVCRLHPIKNIKALVRVFIRLASKYPKIKLWLVGDGEERPALEKLVNDHALGSRARFWGYQKEPATFLAKASVFVLPSFSEGHPVSMIEAMIAGVPVVATNVGGAPEIIVNDANGWLINPLDDDDIHKRLEQVIHLPLPEKVVITTNARRLVVDSFSAESYLGKLDQLYKSLLK